MADKWNPSRYQDDYRTALLKLIEEKVAQGGQGPVRAKPARKRPTNVIDLVSVLQKSLAQVQGGNGKEKAAKSKHRAKLKKAA